MPVYSHTQLSTYEECPLKYKLHYLDKVKIEEAVEGIEGFMGSRVHETLQKCYDDLKYTRINSLDDLLAFYGTVWEKRWHDDVVISKAGLTAANYRALGAKTIENYHRRYAPFDQDVTIYTEKMLHFSLDAEGKYKLRGVIDRLARDKDGTFVIHDYKTSSHLPTQEEADHDRQLALYHIGVKRNWPQARDVRLVWHYLAFDAELVSTRSEESLLALVEDTSNLIDEIESAKDFPAKESFLCNWCDYPHLCPHRKHPARMADLPANEYLKEPGVKLVNKYAELKRQVEEIGAEMDKIREAIVAYARREECSNIQGSGCSARIYFRDALKFPKKGEPERAALENLIREVGKWMEVSDLDVFKLAKIVDEGKWDRKLVDRISKFGQIDPTTTVRLFQAKAKEE